MCTTWFAIYQQQNRTESVFSAFFWLNGHKLGLNLIFSSISTCIPSTGENILRYPLFQLYNFGMSIVCMQHNNCIGYSTTWKVDKSEWYVEVHIISTQLITVLNATTILFKVYKIVQVWTSYYFHTPGGDGPFSFDPPFTWNGTQFKANEKSIFRGWKINYYERDTKHTEQMERNPT